MMVPYLYLIKPAVMIGQLKTPIDQHSQAMLNLTVAQDLV